MVKRTFAIGLVVACLMGCDGTLPDLAILTVSPTSGNVGTTLTITGLGFSATPEDNHVTIGGADATVTSASEFQLVVTAGYGTVSGPIVVEVAGNTATAATEFTLVGPAVLGFLPKGGYQGTLVTIDGQNFGPKVKDNAVSIGGVSAHVVSASTTQLEAIVGVGASSGSVKVTADSVTTEAEDAFALQNWPAAGSGDDGPPILQPGAGDGASPGTLPSTGVIEVLVVVSYPTDRVPGDLVAERQAIADKWVDVNTFYDQASYGTLDVQVTVTDWVTLSGNLATYYEAAEDNFFNDILDRFTAECANGAVGQGIDLDDFDHMACFMWTNGEFVRAWGGWSRSNFAFTDAGLGLDINISTDHEIGLNALGEMATWGRCAHELGHNLVDGHLTLGEDVYDSDLVDPASATAQSFEMMGAHDDDPLFSGTYIEQLGWYDNANIVELQWDRNPFEADYDVVSHRLTEDADPNQYHLVRIKINDGLYYYIEVRQQPPVGDAQIFDDNIPLGAAPDGGGVIVTKVIVDEVNNNQQMRFITLMHDERVLLVGETAVDPARALVITVTDQTLDAADDDRLVCSVNVAWAQDLEPDPDGDFDLRIEPWGAGYETVDIWIDRQPWGTFDNEDGAGNPVGNGDKPQPLAINHFWARAHCDGSEDATDVKVTYYAITPPGVGDNGTWTPLETITHGTIIAGDSEEEDINWVPAVGEHTCLQVWINEQLGETTYGNNKAQENVFEFEAPAESPPVPVKIPLAVRNPLDEPAIILLGLSGVRSGYVAQLPNRWVYLDAKGEKEMEAVVIPLYDINEYYRKEGEIRLKINGIIPRSYTEKVGGVDPASWFAPIGGITAIVAPKNTADIRIDNDEKVSSETGRIGIAGSLNPAYTGVAVEVVLTDPKNRTRVIQVTTDAAGKFSVAFDLTQAPLEDGRQQGTPEVPEPGTYKAKAYIVNDDSIAQAESNEVTIEKP